MSIHQSIETLKNELSLYELKPSKVGATRLRKSLMEMSKACSQTRKEVLETSKSVPVKTRTKKDVQPEPEPESDLSDSSQDPPLKLKKPRKSK